MSDYDQRQARALATCQRNYDHMSPPEDDGPVCEMCEQDLSKEDVKAGNGICPSCWEKETQRDQPLRSASAPEAANKEGEEK